jgi:lipopolysaccharide/colanic/teichoic acid biosynthesis glycosyltransferase
VTGWAQVNGRDELSIEKKVEHDLYYLKNKSIRLDIKIFIITLVKIIKNEGVNH